MIGFVTPEVFWSPIAHVPAGKLYSGGLGVLTDTMARGASELGIPLAVFSILPRYGYYEQVVERHVGTERMGVTFTPNYLANIPKEDCGTVTLKVAGSKLLVKIWKVLGVELGTVDLYLLDADIEGNDWLARVNTHHLYGGLRRTYGGPSSTVEEWRRKVAQTMVLGMGAVAAAEKLGLDIKLWHGNDCHSAFVPLALLKKELAAGALFDAAVEAVKRQWVFTTHTSVQAGNWSTGLDLLADMVRDPVLTEDVLRRIGRDVSDNDVFEFSAACLRLAGAANAVSRKHHGVAARMWGFMASEIPQLTYVTNGTNAAYWQSDEFRNASTAEELAAVKQRKNAELAAYIERRDAIKRLDPSVGTLVWARRFAWYKRPDLLFRYQAEWICRALADGRFNYVIAGKPHPDDDGMVAVWNELYALSRALPNLIVLPNYDMPMSRVLKAGAHLWLNSPRAPNEASGTSGMSAAMNGAVNISTPDGWMAEADERYYYRFGLDYKGPSLHEQDRYDAEELVGALERALEEYRDPEAWFGRALCAKEEAEEHFSAARMAAEYAERVWQIALPGQFG